MVFPFLVGGSDGSDGVECDGAYRSYEGHTSRQRMAEAARSAGNSYGRESEGFVFVPLVSRPILLESN